MRSRIKRIFPFIVLLALFGLGESPVFCSTVILKSPSIEWVAGYNARTSKCIHLSKCTGSGTSSILIFHFTPDYLIAFYHRITTDLLNQVLTFRNIVPELKIASGSFALKPSIDNHIIVISGSTSALIPDHGDNLHQEEIMCISLINGLWSN